jgi:folate-binding protein YgfZ
MTSNELDQYNALSQGFAWWDLSGRGKLALTGPDRVSFLHAVCSNDIQGLGEYEVRRALLLSATGKIQADFHCCRFPGVMLLDIPASVSPEFRNKLQSYIIMDEVQVEDLSGTLAHLAVAGPQAEAQVERCFGSVPPLQVNHACSLGTVSKDGTLGLPILIRRSELADWGYEVLAPAADRERIRSLLGEEGPEVSESVLSVCRIERGIPTFGQEFTNRNNPVEVGLSGAYSLNKGCYPGQEVVSRATFVGGVARRLCQLLLPGDRIPLAGAPIRVGDAEAGRVVSAVYSPRLSAVAAFGFLRREAAESGQQCEVELDAGEWVAAKMATLPAGES